MEKGTLVLEKTIEQQGIYIYGKTNGGCNTRFQYRIFRNLLVQKQTDDMYI